MIRWFVEDRQREGGGSVLAFWEECTERLAQGIGILLQTVNPDAIILGTIAAINKKLVMPPYVRPYPAARGGLPSSTATLSQPSSAPLPLPSTAPQKNLDLYV
ncbi:MAG: ROK family protein [Chlamydiia bacterium]|nr:ROK family protein [Chlamydiia bacterium]